MIIQFTVNGLPKAQPRAKFGRGYVYNPNVADGWRALVTLEARKHKPPSVMLGPVKMRVAYFFPRPKAHFGAGGSLKDSCLDAHIIKPDASNLLKAAEDVITEIGFWKDDCQVWSVQAEKFWTTGKPHAVFYFCGI